MKKIFKTLKIAIFSIALFSTSLLQANDVFVDSEFYSGSRSTSDGSIYGNAGWSSDVSGFDLSWDITLGSAGDPASFNYVYTITGENGDPLAKDLSHLLLSVSDSFTLDNLIDSNYTGEDPAFYEPGKKGWCNILSVNSKTEE